MAHLESLIRLRQHTVDQKQKFLGGLYRQAEEMEARKTTLQEQLAQERKILEEQDMLEALAWFGLYADGVKLKIDLINKEIKQMAERIDIARADLRTAFGELKKIEITAARRKEEERLNALAKENKEMDDIGIEGHRRRNDST